MLYTLILAIVAVIAGAVAAVTGFGAGSLLTPALAVETGTKLAVAAIAIPHFVGTAQRYWMLRRHVDRRILAGFGIASAVGNLSGALLGARFSSRGLAIVFGLLLMLAGITEFTRWMERVRWGRRAAWVAGAVSGVLGGLVGNQGGIRTAAMLGFNVPKESFVATATAIALFVDGARLPVYLATSMARHRCDMAARAHGYCRCDHRNSVRYAAIGMGATKSLSQNYRDVIAGARVLHDPGGGCLASGQTPRSTRQRKRS